MLVGDLVGYFQDLGFDGGVADLVVWDEGGGGAETLCLDEGLAG